MLKILAVFFGGGFGSLSRFLLASYIVNFTERAFFFGTLTVNIIGSFIIGIAWGFFERHEYLDNWRLFIIIGFLGGFTTYSSFALESFTLIKNGSYATAAMYILATNVFAILAAFGGYSLMKVMINS